jgi:hypothetical protein
MKQFIATLVVVGAMLLTAAAAQAQVSQVVYYGGSPTVYSAYYPQATPAYYSPAPTTTYYAPTTAYYPAPSTAYYAASPIVAAPVPVTTTYYRPLIGGTITRTRYVYPATTYAAPVTTYYAPY